MDQNPETATCFTMTDANGYIAKPSGECCLKGSLHDGEPRGRYETIAGVNTYISSPPADKANGNIVLYFPDVFGFFTNGLLVMDGFAEAGYLSIGLDYFRGVRLANRTVRRPANGRRIPCTFIAKTRTTRRLTLALITRRGRQSTLPSRMRRHLDG